MSLDPNNPNPNKINLGARVSKPLRGILATGKRMMSNRTFMRTMRGKMAETGDMTDKVAKKIAFRTTVGVKDLGVTFRIKKKFFGRMNEDGMLSTVYKKSTKNAINKYETLADVESGDTRSSSNQKLKGDENSLNHGEGENERMEKIHDKIEDAQEKKYAAEADKTQNLGKQTVSSAVTSVTHAKTEAHPAAHTVADLNAHHSPQEETEKSFGGPINDPRESLSAENLVQAPPTQLD